MLLVCFSKGSVQFLYPVYTKMTCMIEYCVSVCVHVCNACMCINNSIVVKQTDIYVFSVFSKTVSVINGMVA